MFTYYYDHLAAAEKDISSNNFCSLVDASVMLYDEEHRDLLPKKVNSRCQAKTKKQEKESDKRFFHLFPKKRRTSVVTVRTLNKTNKICIGFLLLHRSSTLTRSPVIRLTHVTNFKGFILLLLHRFLEITRSLLITR